MNDGLDVVYTDVHVCYECSSLRLVSYLIICDNLNQWWLPLSCLFTLQLLYLFIRSDFVVISILILTLHSTQKYDMFLKRIWRGFCQVISERRACIKASGSVIHYHTREHACKHGTTHTLYWQTGRCLGTCLV